MKFGGTSVGSAQRMKDVCRLITQDGTPNMIVLSAMSGTTNTLVEISDYLYKKNPEGANNVINQLEQKYRQHVDELYATEEYKQKTLDFLKDEFDYLRSFTKILFTSFEEKVVLAQGEVISTNMVTNYLKECGVKTILLSALDFYAYGQKFRTGFQLHQREDQRIVGGQPPDTRFTSHKASSAVMHTARWTTCNAAVRTIPPASSERR